MTINENEILPLRVVAQQWACLAIRLAAALQQHAAQEDTDLLAELDALMASPTADYYRAPWSDNDCVMRGEW